MGIAISFFALDPLIILPPPSKPLAFHSQIQTKWVYFANKKGRVTRNPKIVKNPESLSIFHHLEYRNIPLSFRRLRLRLALEEKALRGLMAYIMCTHCCPLRPALEKELLKSRKFEVQISLSSLIHGNS